MAGSRRAKAWRSAANPIIDLGRPEYIHRLNLRIIGEIVEVLNRPVPDRMLVECGRDFGIGPTFEDLCERARDNVAVVVGMASLDRPELIAIERFRQLR